MRANEDPRSPQECASSGLERDTWSWHYFYRVAYIAGTLLHSGRALLKNTRTHGNCNRPDGLLMQWYALVSTWQSNARSYHIGPLTQ